MGQFMNHLLTARELSLFHCDKHLGKQGGIMKSAKDNLIHSVVCTVVFAVVFAIVIACSNNNPQSPMVAGNLLVRLINSGKPAMTAIPTGLSSGPLLAAFFQTSSSGSQLQQSFGEDGPCLQATMPAMGYIPFQGNDTGAIVLNGKVVATACEGVFAQIGGTDEITGGTLANPGGYPMYFAGTLTTLVVTGTTIAGATIRCSDLTTTVSVQDQQAVEAWYVIATQSVILASGTTQFPFTCNLNIPTGDQLYYIRAQWAKV